MASIKSVKTKGYLVKTITISYVEIREHLLSFKTKGLEILFLSITYGNKVSILIKKMVGTIDSATFDLWNASRSLSTSRVYFDTVIPEFPEIEERLGSSVSIVHSAKFESTICDLQDKWPMNVILSEQKGACYLLMQTESDKKN